MGCLDSTSMLWWPFNKPEEEEPMKMEAPVERIEGEEMPSSGKKKKRRFGQAQRDLGPLSLGKGGILGGGDMPSLFG